MDWMRKRVLAWLMVMYRKALIETMLWSPAFDRVDVEELCEAVAALDAFFNDQSILDD